MLSLVPPVSPQSTSTAPVATNPRAASGGRNDAPTCNIWYVRQQLGREDYQNRRIVRFVALLVSERGFPPPLPAMVGKALCTEVTLRSLWRREAVDAWLNDLLPPPIAQAMEENARHGAAAEMAQRAEELGRRA